MANSLYHSLVTETFQNAKTGTQSVLQSIYRRLTITFDIVRAMIGVDLTLDASYVLRSASLATDFNAHAHTRNHIVTNTMLLFEYELT